MLSGILKVIFNKKFLFSIILHILHGFIFEKSKLYYPYTFDRNILLIKTDLFKFYLATSFIFLSVPYLLSKMSPNKYLVAYSYIENRYKNRNTLDIQIGGYLLGISMIFTGFCPSYLPIYLAINPIIFFYCIAVSYTAYVFYHVFGTLFFSRISVSRINEINNSPSTSSDRQSLNNIGRFIIISISILLLLIFEASEQSLSPGHSSDELFDLLYCGDYLPPGLTGLLCGCINFLLIFFCDEYQTLTSEWLINIFYHTSDFTSDQRNTVTGQLCIEQILKILSMAFGVRLSLWTSKREEIPNLDWLFYSLVGIGSFIGAFAVCFTTATFSDHIYLKCAFIGNVPHEVISLPMNAAWVVLYLSKLLGLSNLK
ncbi:unnamed protein product [Rotaria sp. Silwood2]|nr:unnamed protein product [Rotaria sp. Silwood2]CAF3060338.1 unnamed protein product [Rotaria sp. Silwood2]CAF4044907.1 unnamed protein product [Rotaria sp. Silwood2]CAF4048221.1 unnamed protein product [Rotaria sp. Silwood2]CAF4093362.1 unnamed protein product [Rotaria sp. Silwood2]